MIDPFAALADVLFSSALAAMVDYESVAGGGVFGIPALVRRPDTEGDFGDVRISHDVRRFEIRVDDLVGLPQDPARGDTITTSDGVAYKVQAPPYRDRLGLVWIVDAYKE